MLLLTRRAGGRLALLFFGRSIRLFVFRVLRGDKLTNNFGHLFVVELRDMFKQFPLDGLPFLLKVMRQSLRSGQAVLQIDRLLFHWTPPFSVLVFVPE